MKPNSFVKIFVSLLLFVVLMDVIYVIRCMDDQAHFAGPSHRKHPELTAKADRLPTSLKPAPVRKLFVYLTQTESCATNEFLAWAGNSSSCNCDGIVASYKVPCERNRMFPPHIQHVFTPGTTWGSGRNFLFFMAWNRNPGYQYYIFMDDDVTAKFTAFTPPEMAASLDPFRAFERFLLDYEPALGIMGYRNRATAPAALGLRKKVCGKKDTPLAIPVTSYDANFNAYHRDAVLHVLPYRIKYDFDSFYHAPSSAKVAQYIKFHGQTLMFTATRIVNPKHRPYQKSGPLKVGEVWREWIRAVRKVTPPEFQNNKQFKEMLSDPNKWVVEGGGITCMDAIKHQPIIPYEHFRRALDNPKNLTSS